MSDLLACLGIALFLLACAAAISLVIAAIAYVDHKWPVQ